MILKVKLDSDKGALLPIRAHSTDAGADILTPRSFLLAAESSAIIRTGVHVKLPQKLMANHMAIQMTGCIKCGLQ